MKSLEMENSFGGKKIPKVFFKEKFFSSIWMRPRCSIPYCGGRWYICREQEHESVVMYHPNRRDGVMGGSMMSSSQYMYSKIVRIVGQNRSW